MGKKISQNKKNTILLSILALYELVRSVLIIRMSSSSFANGTEGISESLLSIAYFYSVPLLIIPFLIFLGKIFAPSKFSTCTIFIPIIKLLSVISFFGYICINTKQILLKVRMGETQFLTSLIFLVIFLIIDVIIGVAFFIKEMKNNDEGGEILCK